MNELAADQRPTAKQNLFLAFLTFINVMNFVDRQLLASFANFIVPELGLSNAQFGWLTGFAFIVLYLSNCVTESLRHCLSCTKSLRYKACLICRS